MSKNRIKRTNKTLELQAQYYECEDFITFLIEKWELGYTVIKYYLELSVTERYKVIHYLITEKPCNSWQNIVLHLLNPNSKRNNGNKQ